MSLEVNRRIAEGKKSCRDVGKPMGSRGRSLKVSELAEGSWVLQGLKARFIAPRFEAEDLRRSRPW